MAANDKDAHQRKQKQRGMEKSNASKINSNRSLHPEGFNKMITNLTQIHTRKDRHKKSHLSSSVLLSGLHYQQIKSALFNILFI